MAIGLWRVRKDGSAASGRWWSLMRSGTRRGELIGFAKVTRDITERQEAHWNLLPSERRYRLLVEAVVDYAIFQLDPAGHVSTWNTGAERSRAIAVTEIVGQHFSRFYTAEDRAGRRSAKSIATAAQRVDSRPRDWRVRKDGSSSGLRWS